jgi:hypothetical protein
MVVTSEADLAAGGSDIWLHCSYLAAICYTCIPLIAITTVLMVFIYGDRVQREQDWRIRTVFRLSWQYSICIRPVLVEFQRHCQYTESLQF